MGAPTVVEYLGWETQQQPTLIAFKVTNRGDAPPTPTTGSGETLDPPPSQITAPHVPAIAPGASYEIRYAVYPTDACANQRVRMSVPQPNDRSSKGNTLEVQLWNKDKDVDLKLEYVGADPTNQQLIHFRVTNVGKVSTPALPGHVETIMPLPAQETAPPIPALAPGASFEARMRCLGQRGPFRSLRPWAASMPAPAGSSPFEGDCRWTSFRPKAPARVCR